MAGLTVISKKTIAPSAVPMKRKGTQSNSAARMDLGCPNLNGITKRLLAEDPVSTKQMPSEFHWPTATQTCSRKGTSKIDHGGCLLS